MAQAGNTALEVRREGVTTVIAPKGDWLAAEIAPYDAQLRRLEAEVDPGAVVIDVSGLGRIDTAGAYMLGRILNRCAHPDAEMHYRGDHASARSLIGLVHERMAPCPPTPSSGPGIIAALDRAGRGFYAVAQDIGSTLAFLGETIIAAGRGLVQPGRIRWAASFHMMEQAGLNALPIIATLSFFVGAVLAFLGANLLRQFGAEVFAVELVAFSVLREFAVVITAVMIAGRSGSAFTAQIGAMRMQQEVDAMRVIGLDPIETLVLPRLFACVVMTPLLTFAAMMMGLFGGMIILWLVEDISATYFIVRMRELPVQYFWTGLLKAPFFAAVIAAIACRQGLLVGGDVESLGSRVTSSVVQSIFAVIVLDAIFAMIYLELGL